MAQFQEVVMDDIKINDKDRNKDVIIKNLEKDIVLQKARYEQDLIDQKKYYESIIAAMPGHVYWQDTNNVYLGCNDLQAKNAGLESRHEIVGKKLSDMLETKQAKKLDYINKEIMRTGKPYSAEEYATMKNGKAIYLSHKAALRNEKGEIIGLLGISIDITERKEMENKLLKTTQELLKANCTKAEFIMNMSHDIRTPFTGILGSGTILQESASTPEQQELSGYIVESAEQLLKFINEILDEACYDCKHDGHYQQLVSFNVENLLDTIQQIMAATINHKKLNFHIKCPTNTPARLIGNKLSIKQILLNLVSNAIKFTEQGGTITLTVSFIPGEANNITLIIQVQDTGIGIPKDKQEVIFERFTRLVPSYSGQHTGNGLGLWKTKQTLKQLKGTISVNSEENQGSIFTCRIPLQLPMCIERIAQPITIDENPENVSNTVNLRKKNNPVSKLHFLLVEDEIIASNVAKYMLTEYFDCRLDIAHTGEISINLANQHTYDLVILDIGLPDQSGFNVAKQIHQRSIHNQKTPIIGLTAHQPDRWGEEEGRQFFKAIYSKPLTPKICVQIASIVASNVS